MPLKYDLNLAAWIEDGDHPTLHTAETPVRATLPSVGFKTNHTVIDISDDSGEESELEQYPEPDLGDYSSNWQDTEPLARAAAIRYHPESPSPPAPIMAKPKN
jgi:hypothetical protein